MSSPVNPGDVLAGKYRVERVLGSGGMGVVVAAKHLQLGERVAIKFLLPHALERKDVVNRFLREGRAAARIRSEHVARVYDVGTLEGGAPFLVMEYLDGHDLGAVLRTEGSLSIEVAVEYVLQTCEALAEAHATGTVHRDLKPGNLFLTKRADGSATIKLIDFGISKVANTGGEVESEIEMTRTAVMMGSPLYMAPEQMASARDVDARSDLWSLGVILYSLLTGGPPFKATSVMGVYELIIKGAPPLRAALPSAPEGLEAIILRCLKKNPNDRYANVAEFATALAEFAPPEARYYADRIARVIKGAASALPPDPARALALSSTPPAGPPLENGLEGSSDAKAIAAADADPGPPADPSGIVSPTDSSWGQTRPPTRRRSRAPFIAAVVFGLLGLVGAIGLLSLRSGSSHGGPAAPSAAPVADPALAPIPALAATPAPATAAAAVTAGAPTAAAPTVAVATASPDPTTSAAAPVASGTPRAAGKPPVRPGSAAATPAPPPPPSHPKDLFNDPR